MVHSARARLSLRALRSSMQSSRSSSRLHHAGCCASSTRYGPSSSRRIQSRLLSTSSAMAAQRSASPASVDEHVAGTISPSTPHAVDSYTAPADPDFDFDAPPADISSQTSSHESKSADPLSGSPSDAIESRSDGETSSSSEKPPSRGRGRPVTEHFYRRRDRERRSLTPPGSLFQVFPCTEPGCRKQFVAGSSLDEHLAMHEMRKRHKFHCDKCPLTFEKESGLRKHAEIHDDTRCFPCPVCGDNFTRENSLFAHLAKMGTDHESVKGSRLISISPEDMCNGDLFASFEPIVEQRLQHATWPQRKETINRTDVLLADQDEEFEEEFTGKLSLTEAPPCAFFSIETVEGKKIPRIVQFPLSAEPNELLATLTVDLHRLLGTKDGRSADPDTPSPSSSSTTAVSSSGDEASLPEDSSTPLATSANSTSDDSPLGEYKMFFAGCSTPKRSLQFKHSPVRFVVMLARREDWARAEAIGCVEMDPFRNHIMRYDREDGVWYRPCKYTPMPNSEVSVIVAVANGVPNLQDVNAQWLDVAKIGFKLNSPLIRCPVCALCVSGRKIALLHFAVQHEGFRFKCAECPLEFASKLGLETHVDAIHKELRFKCDTCEKSFNTEMYLKNHMRSHTGEFRCDGCGKDFGNINHFRGHNKKRTQCEICGKKLCYQDEARAHFILHHGGPEYVRKYPFKCSACDFVSAYKQNVERHARTRHEETLDEVYVLHRRTGQQRKVKR